MWLLGSDKNQAAPPSVRGVVKERGVGDEMVVSALDAHCTSLVPTRDTFHLQYIQETRKQETRGDRQEEARRDKKRRIEGGKLEEM